MLKIIKDQPLLFTVLLQNIEGCLIFYYKTIQIFTWKIIKMILPLSLQQNKKIIIVYTNWFKKVLIYMKQISMVNALYLLLINNTNNKLWIFTKNKRTRAFNWFQKRFVNLKIFFYVIILTNVTLITLKVCFYFLYKNNMLHIKNLIFVYF